MKKPNRSWMLRYYAVSDPVAGVGCGTDIDFDCYSVTREINGMNPQITNCDSKNSPVLLDDVGGTNG